MQLIEKSMEIFGYFALQKQWKLVKFITYFVDTK